MGSPPCDTILTVWPTIEQFADLPSTVAMAQTCRALKEEIVDPGTWQIKVSHFVVRQFRDDRRQRIPHIPHAINNIHWPSLRRVDLAFYHPPFMGGEEVEDATFYFPMFVSHLANAHSLESLQLDLCAILHMASDTSDRGDGNEVDTRKEHFKLLLELLGRNLGRCKELKDLSISFSGTYCPLLMQGLMQALTSVLVKRGDKLGRVHFDMGLSGDDNEIRWVEPSTWESFHAAATNFFEWVLSCHCLNVLEISIPRTARLSKALLSAAGRVQMREWRSLHRLNLCIVGAFAGFPGDEVEERPVLSEDELAEAKLLLDVFADCSELEELCLGLPYEVWGAHTDAITSMLRRQPNLPTLTLCFGSYYDEDGKMLELLRECAIVGDESMISDFNVVNLRGVDGKCLFLFLQDLKECGGVIDHDAFRARYMNVEGEELIDPIMKADDMPENAKVAITRIRVQKE